MSNMDTISPAPGKIPAGIFRRVIRPHLGAASSAVLLGPEHGVDAGVIDLGEGRVLALTTDPFFVMPLYGWKRAAWFALHIVASDACTSGLRPLYLTIDLNLPPNMPDGDLEALWLAIHDTCLDLGLAIVTGHTGRYDGCDFPMLGAATILSLGPREQLVMPSMIRPGDALIITKGAAIETAGMFGAAFPEQLARAIGPALAAEADALFDRMSVVDDALAAAEVGAGEAGITCMHDATERGVWGAIAEIAEAGGAGVIVDQDAIPVPVAARAICELFDLDPFCTSSEGTLILTCRPQRAGPVLARLDSAGIPAWQIGEITPPADCVRVVHAGRERPLSAPEADPFWPAFATALERWSSAPETSTR